MSGKITQHRGSVSANSAAQAQARKRPFPANFVEQSAAPSSPAVEVAIVGDGGSGLAMGASLAVGGHSVRLAMASGSPPRQCLIVGRRQASGQPGQLLSFKQVDKDIAASARGAEVVVVSARTGAYAA